jgi:hypothetical protein
LTGGVDVEAPGKVHWGKFDDKRHLIGAVVKLKPTNLL